MKTVVITGSARGLGLELAKEFRKVNYNVVISDLFIDDLEKARKELVSIKSKGSIKYVICNVTKEKDIDNLISESIKRFKSIDIFINNAGINQPSKAIWELDSKSINSLIDVDLRGTVMCSNKVMNVMIKQGYGAIYNVEGHGSNDNVILGLSMYGTTKRAITYFTEALAKEVSIKGLNIQVGKLSPGIMITNFIVNSLRNNKMELDDKTKKVYNILGDYPDRIAKFLVSKMINNKKNNVKFTWLTTLKASIRFMTSSFNKRDFFK